MEWVEEKNANLGAEARVRKNGFARRKKAWVKKVNPCPFIRAEETMRLPTCLVNLAYSPSAVIDGAVGLPTPVLMRIP